MDLSDIYRVFYLTAVDYVFFSASHETFSKMDFILGHKIVLINTEKDQNNLQHHTGIKLKIKIK
jgi:hypothetical protein